MTERISAILPKTDGQVFAVRVPARRLTSGELQALARSFGVWAEDQELPEFNWSDAGFLMQEIAKSTNAAAKEV